MKTISLADLKKKIDNKEDFKLVNTLSEWQFNAKHIPGSIHVGRPEEAAEKLKKDDDIIVYCSYDACSASQMAYTQLVEQGYKNVKRYSGGIDEWERAGYPLEGEMVDSEEVEKEEEKKDQDLCSHISSLNKNVNPKADGCVDCLKTGDEWVHLRLCLTCGNVGCCNDSKNKHATKHFVSTDHPVIKSFEKGETWKFCYIDDLFIE